MRPAESWVLATTNPGKLAEYRDLLTDAPIRLVRLDSSDSPAETGLTFVENALIKARHAARLSGLPALADDSGLCVDALAGSPGILSARYAGPSATDEQNVARLLEDLTDVETRSAAFHCVIVAIRAPDDPLPVIATGAWPGRIARAPTGSNGFGYDPVFFDPELGATAAELPPERKNAVSHRARACRQLASRLDSEPGLCTSTS